MMKLIAERQ